MFRTFVLPVPLAATRYVRGVEIRPGNPRAIHHASVGIDRSRASRQLDARDPEPGFPGGMLSEGTRSPESRAIGWTPGMTPVMEPDGMAWRLEPGTDLIVQVHLLPPAAGEPALVDLSVGLSFTDAPPTRTPIDFRLGSKAIDIPPGTARYTVEDFYVLPVDVEVLSVYPHAHYLATEMTAIASLPDGRSLALLRIPAVELPLAGRVPLRGTAVPAEGHAAPDDLRLRQLRREPGEPSGPPAHVVYGPQSSDEMGDLWLRLVPRTPDDAAVLARSYVEHELRKETAIGEQLVARRPQDARLRNALAAAYIRGGRVADAIAQLDEALRLAPSLAEARYNLGRVLESQGRIGDATLHLREAARLAPENALVRLALADVLQAAGDLDEAVVHLRRAIALNPQAADTHNNLGVALGSLGLLDEAAAHFRAALEIRPDYEDARTNLDLVLQLQNAPVRGR